MEARIDTKLMKNRGWVANTFLERFRGGGLGAKLSERPSAFRPLLATFFHQKSKKWHPKRHPKIDAGKVWKNDAKRFKMMQKLMPKKGIQKILWMLLQKKVGCPH